MSFNLMETAKTVLDEMISKLGIVAEVTIVDDDGERKLDLKSPEAGRLIGRKGQSLEGLELIVNRILRKQTSKTRTRLGSSLKSMGTAFLASLPPGVTVGFQVRYQRLEHIAKDAAKEVKMWGEPKRIGPYKPGERRIIILL